MRHALTILTHVPAGGPAGLRRRLPEALRTLEQSGYPGEVFVVDDGSSDGEHLRFLDSLPPGCQTVRRVVAGGIPRAKNTCLRVLIDAGIDVGFLAEDDIEFRPGWWEPYLDAHRRTGIAHFSWADDGESGMKKTLRTAGGCPLVQTSRLNGVLLTFTRRVVERVGGFRLLPGRWGHTHTNWTLRIVQAGLAPFFCDVADSNRLIGVSRHGRCSTVADAEKRRWRRENAAAAFDLSRLYEPLEPEAERLAGTGQRPEAANCRSAFQGRPFVVGDLSPEAADKSATTNDGLGRPSYKGSGSQPSDPYSQLGETPLVIGLGSGRCGTLSLAKLLDFQPAAAVTHERHDREMSWSGAERVVDRLLHEMTTCRAALAGDVAHYHLPYVRRLARCPGVRFVCLQRDRGATVASFLSKTGEGHRWLDHDGTRWRRDPVWDKCFPKYGIEDRAAAIDRYWDEYYGEAERLERELPGRFRVFPTEALNSAAGQREILSFAGVPERFQVLRPGMRLNAS